MKLAQVSAQEIRERAVTWAIAVAIPLAVTVVGAQMALPAFVFEHVMVVVVVGLAVVGGRAPAIAAAVAGGVR